MPAGGLASTDFASFFRAVWGVDPFPWQERLLRRIATGEDPHHDYKGDPGLWPDVLDLPTGSGKTATLDIALFHLALESARGATRRAPTRIAFVVDRRLVVDDVFQRAKTLARKLRDAIEAPSAADPTVLKVAHALCDLAGSDEPLLVRSLRGGAPLEDDWVRTPVQPTILCSTVDQVGSRLLFRGYGVSDRMKPIHAGLLGSDCLILLDEAHLSEPFRQTLKEVEKLRGTDQVRTPFAFAVLTATPTIKPERPFELSQTDRAHSVLSPRLGAKKEARLVEISAKPGVDAEARRVEVITDQAKMVLESLGGTGIAHPAVGVVINRVARARAVFERLEAELQDTVEIMLLIGPARAADRNKHAKDLDPIRTRQRETPRELSKPLVVVATQTIEVGVDIDFDGLVTEAASLDALRQRFGRLNRAGRPITPDAVVLAHKEDVSAKADDAVYGDRIAKTWATLQRLAAEANGKVDFGVEALHGRISDDEAANLSAATENAPVLLPAYADLWSQTWPIPNADPEVALFLHGPNRAPASIRIVWRADIEQQHLLAAARAEEQRSRLTELLELAPPRSGESVEVPLWAARAFLEQNVTPLAGLSDISEREPPETYREGGRLSFRYAGGDSERTQVVQPRELQNGDLIVVPARYGGCDKWGWNPGSNDPVSDAADAAARPYAGRRYAVRLTGGLIAQAHQGQGPVVVDLRANEEEWKTRLAAVLAREDDAAAITEAVLALSPPTSIRSQLMALEYAKGRRGRSLSCSFPYPTGGTLGGVVLLAPLGLESATNIEAASLSSTESDELGSNPGYTKLLDEHMEDVGRFTAAFTARAGLDENCAKDVILAALFHDAGKADPRFQAWLAGGNPFGWDENHPLAKSGAVLPKNARVMARLPERWRHEALSVRLARLHPRFCEATDPALVLWLIGTHHGYGRPLFPHADPLDAHIRANMPAVLGARLQLEPSPGPQSLAFDFEGLDWAEMYKNLKQRYGVWGLARLEAFVRLADHRASEEGAPPEAARPRKEAAE
jgi:CRISPR-associated endonuclease/helicase Cas3